MIFSDCLKFNLKLNNLNIVRGAISVKLIGLGKKFDGSPIRGAVPQVKGKVSKTFSGRPVGL